MFARSFSSLRGQMRTLATEAKVAIPESVTSHAQQPPKYVLTTLRDFPSLKPNKFQPIPTTLLNTPLRRDILWKAVIFDADNKRVGSSNPKGRSEMGYSRKKLLPQKGTGRARSGDRGSPIRHDGGIAMARSAPNDMTSDLPKKVYSLAVRIALSEKYRKGELVVLENDLDLISNDPLVTSIFLKEHELQKNKLLFVTNEHSKNLLDATEPYQKKIDVVQKEGIQVRDLLNSHKVFIDYNSLEWLYNEYDNVN